MAASEHTYGPTCLLARNVAFSGVKGDNDCPPLKTQFFYSSPLPIDDPLTPVPPPSGDVTKVKHPPRPFSTYDNNALEEAWLGLSSGPCKKSHARLSPSPIRAASASQEEQRAILITEIAAKHITKHKHEDGGAKTKISSKEEELGHEPQPGEDRFLNSEVEPCCKDLVKDVKYEQHKKLSGRYFRQGKQAEVEVLLTEIIVEINRQTKVKSDKGKGKTDQKEDDRHNKKDKEDKKLEKAEKEDDRHDKKDEEDKKLEKAEKKIEKEETKVEKEEKKAEKKERKHARKHNHSSHASAHDGAMDFEFAPGVDDPADGGGVTYDPPNDDAYRQPAVDNAEIAKFQGENSNSMVTVSTDGVSGKPFQRVPSPTGSPAPHYVVTEAAPSSPLAQPEVSCDDLLPENNVTVHVHRCKAKKLSKAHVDIAVGISRLHLVELPVLQMKPIYWSPVHDVAAVIRGTWFYKDTMYAVEPAAANQLEMGYEELRPWSQTWNDQLTSALNIGAEGEEKIQHRLWLKDETRPLDDLPKAPPSDQYCAARCFNGEMAAEGTVDLSRFDDKKSTAGIVRRYPNSSVIYRDSHNAYILKPSLQPSAYYGRRPLAKICKGITVGIHVVRGFDWKLWYKKHPDHKAASSKAHDVEDCVPATGTAANKKQPNCHACSAKQEQPKASDLVLVIHGIGQKLSERVESFHFTHAINAFRRQVNVELSNENVQSVLRPNLGGIMVLPVNWRSNLSFEDGGPRNGKEDSLPSDFSLKDITPETMPSVRNLISDVMLDIPFYMSHHKPKMIEALIYEANRVYGLWCKNNPHFHKEGRVHLIAHSLGSAMAVDVLSKQPTIPAELNTKKVHTKFFDFDTKSLFFVGSPAGFFLLLEKGKLVPRRGRGKPGAEKHYDQDESITGEAGTYGCLAVDNLYNIMVSHTVPPPFFQIVC